MGKFKVGDRVRIASGPDNGGYGRVGDTGIIEAVGRTDCFVHYDSGSRTGESWYVGFDHLEPASTDDQNGSTAGFTVPLCAYEDDPGRHATELGRAYADGYAAGWRASLTQAA